MVPRETPAIFITKRNIEHVSREKTIESLSEDKILRRVSLKKHDFRM